jgi:nondiscriminating glutamyl-tRNA synthetase
VEDRWLERLVALIRDEMTRLSDVVELTEWALSETFVFSADAERALQAAPTRPVLARLVAELAHVVLLDEQTARSILQSMQQAFADSFHWEARQVYWPIRAALTGRVRGPALHEIMALLGKGRCLERTAVILRMD